VNARRVPQFRFAQRHFFAAAKAAHVIAPEHDEAASKELVGIGCSQHECDAARTGVEEIRNRPGYPRRQ
jgi:hypothetical protein